MKDSFCSSFWPPSVSTDSFPNYSHGIMVLHDRLLKSMSENDAIIDYLQRRVHIEKQCADLFTTTPLIPTTAADTSMNASLKGAFDTVIQEHTETAHCHRIKAALLEQDVLDPLVQFTFDFKTNVNHRYEQLQEEIEEFRHLTQTVLMTRSVYWSACHALELECPEYRPPLPYDFEEDITEDLDDMEESSFIGSNQLDGGGVRLGKYTVLPYRQVAKLIRSMTKMLTLNKEHQAYLGQDIVNWMHDHCVTSGSKDSESLEICTHLVALKFLAPTSTQQNFNVDAYYRVQHHVVERYLRKTRLRRSFDDDTTTWQVPPKKTENTGFSRFFKKAIDPSLKLQTDMLEADVAYKLKIESVDALRRELEENMVDYFDEMQALEMKRIQTIKQAFVTLASTLDDTLSIAKETYSRISLVQELLKPEQDIQFIVEQLKTGLFCPKPIIYENYYYGSAIHQLFSVPLEEVAQIYGTYVPPLINKGLDLIESVFNLKRHDELEDAVKSVWMNDLPIKDLNELCSQINGLAGSKLNTQLEHFEPLVIANLIRMYLLELPECLLTFDLYEPVKILYSSPHNDRLVSVSKLLATLPSPNYHTLKAISYHFFKYMKNNENLLNDILSSFSYVLMRPHTFSRVNIYDQHPRRLLRDLITRYDVLFTNDVNEAQRSSASRSAIVAVDSPSESSVSSPVILPTKITLFEYPNSGESTPPSEQEVNRMSEDLDSILNITTVDQK